MANFPNNAALPRGGIDSRSLFITRTYTHLVAGILGFILVELGLFESGLAAALFGAVPAVVAGGIATIVIAAAWTRLFPSLASVDRLDDLRPVSEPG